MRSVNFCDIRWTCGRFGGVGFGSVFLGRGFGKEGKERKKERTNQSQQLHASCFRKAERRHQNSALYLETASPNVNKGE